MDSERQGVGFSEMWQPVYDKYKFFFEAAVKLGPIVNEMARRRVEGRLLQIVGLMAISAANTNGALLTLALNGYGHDAMKLARSLFETEMNILWLKNDPKDLQDFLDYNVIQQKEAYDELTEEQQREVPKDRYEKMMEEYTRILPRFASGRDKNRSRNEWCRVSLYKSLVREICGVIGGFSGEADRGIGGTYGRWSQRTAVVALS